MQLIGCLSITWASQGWYRCLPCCAAHCSACSETKTARPGGEHQRWKGHTAALRAAPTFHGAPFLAGLAPAGGIRLECFSNIRRDEAVPRLLQSQAPLLATSRTAGTRLQAGPKAAFSLLGCVHEGAC